MGQDRPHAVRLAALLVLRRWQSPAIAGFLSPGDGFSVPLAEEAARAVYDLPINDAFPVLATLASRTDLSPTTRRRALYANLRLGEAEQARQVSDIASLEQEDVTIRKTALKVLEQWGESMELDPVIGFYRPIPSHSSEIAAAEISRIVAGCISL